MTQSPIFSECDASAYNGLRTIVDAWLAERTRILSAAPDDIRDSVAHDARWAAHLLERRRFADFARMLYCRTPLQRSLLELFQSSRMHRYVMAYMSVQEGETWDSVDAPSPHIATLMSQSLSRLGKASLVKFVFPLGRWRIAIDLDPFVRLRRAYAALLRSRRRTGFRRIALLGDVRRCVWGFKLRVFIVALCLGLTFQRRRAPQTPQDWQRLFNRQAHKRTICLAILTLFPSAKALSTRQWEELLDRLFNYFSKNLPTLFNLLPMDANVDNGLAKLAKLAFGVIVGRVALRDIHEPNDVDFIANTCRLAYSWGVTYPLVDNVIDRKHTSDDVRNGIVSVIANIFSDRSGEHVPLSEPLLAELAQRMTEIRSLLHRDRAGGALKALRILLIAHHRDSSRRMFPVHHQDAQRRFEAVWADTLLKAAMARIATRGLCGETIWPIVLDEYLSSALLNQFGDDLWDIVEDLREDRLTPFTLFLQNETPQNPFSFYIAHVLMLAADASPTRRLSLLFGMQETCRCFLESCVAGADGPCRDALELLETELDRFAPAISFETLLDVPHLDLDAVIFKMGAAISGQRTSVAPAA